MKKVFSVAFSALALSIAANASASTPHQELPAPFESVFNESMNDPNVMVYHADMAFRNGQYDEALRWMLEASKYNLPSAVENTKYLIQHNLGTAANREQVVSFLTYFAEDQGADIADPFAQMYLADYYRGDKCVWFAPEAKADCAQEGSGPMAGYDMKKSYFYYESAAKIEGQERAQYTAGMMNLLSVGVPRNVPYALDFLRPLAEKGNVAVAYLVGSVYQLGYWMPQDRAEASKWFSIGAKTKHPGSLLYMAQNYESGVLKGSVEERVTKAAEAYEDILKGVLANDAQRSEAAYRLGLIYAGYDFIRDNKKAVKAMEKAVSFADDERNEYAVKAILWLGDQFEKTDLTRAVKHYDLAITHLESLSLDIQQRYAVAWEKAAHAYGRGQSGNLERDERMFGKYMNQRHRLMSKSYVPQREPLEFQGYKVFNFPG